MSVPTVLGMPIKVITNATLTVGFKYQESDAKFDFPDAKLNLKVTPRFVKRHKHTANVIKYITNLKKFSPNHLKDN
jgi:hypothetical protein